MANQKRLVNVRGSASLVDGFCREASKRSVLVSRVPTDVDFLTLQERRIRDEKKGLFSRCERADELKLWKIGGISPFGTVKANEQSLLFWSRVVNQIEG